MSGRLRIALTRLPGSVCWISPSGTICGLASLQGLRGASLCPIRSPPEQQIAKIILTSVLRMRRAIPVAVEGAGDASDCRMMLVKIKAVKPGEFLKGLVRCKW